MFIIYSFITSTWQFCKLIKKLKEMKKRVGRNKLQLKGYNPEPFTFFLSLTGSDLPAGTVGMGRVHPRRVGRARARRVDGFFFQNRTLPVLYPCPSRVHEYHRYGYGGTRARVDGYGYGNFFFCFFPAGSAGTSMGIDLMWTGGGFLKFEFHGSTGTGGGYTGTGTNGFFQKKKKTWPALLKPVPVYRGEATVWSWGPRTPLKIVFYQRHKW
jgi:hypothetical protein